MFCPCCAFWMTPKSIFTQTRLSYAAILNAHNNDKRLTVVLGVLPAHNNFVQWTILTNRLLQQEQKCYAKASQHHIITPHSEAKLNLETMFLIAL